MCFCYSVLQVSSVLHCCVSQKTFEFEKATSQHQKNLHNEKSYLITHEYVVLLCKFNEQQQQ